MRVKTIRAMALIALLVGGLELAGAAPALAAPDPLPLSWAYRSGDAALEIQDLAQNDADETLVAGNYTGGASRLRSSSGWVDLPADAGGYGQGFIARVDRSGAVLDVATIGSAAGDDYVARIAPLPGGDVAALLILSGPVPTGPPAASSPDGWVLARVAPDGALRWAVAVESTFTHALAASATHISVTGRTEVTGPFGWPGTVEGTVHDYALDGSLRWSRTFQSPDQDEGRSLAHTPDGGLVVAGTFGSGPGTFPPSALSVPAHADGTGFVAKYDSSGMPQWAFGLPTAIASSATTVAVSPAGQIYAAAYGGGDPIVFPTPSGPDTVDLSDPLATYLVALDPSGTVLWADNMRRAFEKPTDLVASDNGVTALESDPVLTPNGSGVTVSDAALVLTRWTATGTKVFEQQASQRTGAVHLGLQHQALAVDSTGGATVAALLDRTATTLGSGSAAITLDPAMSGVTSTSSWGVRPLLAHFGAAVPSPRHHLVLAGSAVVAAGGATRVHLDITNTGPDAASAVVVDQIVADLLSPTSATASKGTVTGRQWVVGELAAGETASLDVDADALPGATCSVGWRAIAQSSGISESDERTSWKDLSVTINAPVVADPDVAWVDVQGGAGSWQDVTTGVSISRDGDVYAVGTFNGTATFGKGATTRSLTTVSSWPGYDDTFVARYDADGAVLALSQLTGLIEDASVAALDDGGAIVAGKYYGAMQLVRAGGNVAVLPYPGTRGALFVLRLSATGDVLWARSARQTGTSWWMTTPALRVTSSAILLAGNGDTMRFSTPSGVVQVPGWTSYIATWDLAGTAGPVMIDPTEQAGSNEHVYLTIDALPGGDLVVGGSFRGNVQIGTSAGTMPLSSGGNRGFVARLSATTGAAAWAIANAGSGATTDLDVTQAGAVVVGGLDNSSGYVRQLDSNGSTMWNHAIDTTGSVNNVRVGENGAGDVVAAGGFSGTTRFTVGSGTEQHSSVGPTDLWALRLTANGAFDRLWTASGPDDDGLRDLAVGNGRGFVIGGRTSPSSTPANGFGTTTFGSQLACQRGGGDGYTTSYRDGAHGWIQGTLRDASGAPAAGVTVTAMRGFSAWQVGYTTVTGADGRYLVPDATVGTYRLRFFDGAGRFQRLWWGGAPTYSSGQDLVVGAGRGATADATLPARPSGQIRGRVRDAGGAGVPGAVVFVFAPQGMLAATATGPSGYYQLGGLAAGSYRVLVLDPQNRFTPEWWQNSSTYQGSAPIDVGADPVTINLDVG